MSMCYGLEKTGLKGIVEGCKKLDSWNLAWTELNSEDLDLICTSAPQALHRINISGCRLTLKDERKYFQVYFVFDCVIYNATFFSLIDVLLLCKRCPNLVELDISDATAISSSSVNYIHEHLMKLEYLAMARCYNVQLSVYL